MRINPAALRIIFQTLPETGVTDGDRELRDDPSQNLRRDDVHRPLASLQASSRRQVHPALGQVTDPMDEGGGLVADHHLVKVIVPIARRAGWVGREPLGADVL